METRDTRLRLLVVVAAAGLAGIVLETALDSVEGTGGAVLGLLVALVVLGAVGGHWYSRQRRRLDGPDERVRAIERRASRISHGVLTFGLAAVALTTTVAFVDATTGPVLWALLVASVLAHELSIEYYRRQM